MKWYILCPYVQTGGPEAMHQLCNEINLLATTHQAYMVYLNKPTTSVTSLLYADDYPYLKEALFKEIEDSPANIVVLPEIYTKRQLPFYTIRVAIWWLSINNAIQFNTFYENLKQVIHLFQSEYASTTILKHHPQANIRTFMLHDYTRVLAEPALLYAPQKRANKIAYNPTKDTILPTLIHAQYLVPLVNLNKEELHDALLGCKLYIDLGSHPGQDRLPREAAMAGCVVITNKAGAADNAIDIPIEEKVEDSAALFQLIQHVFENDNDNYKHYYKKQEPYRIAIANEKTRFTEEVRHILSIFE